MKVENGLSWNWKLEGLGEGKNKAENNNSQNEINFSNLIFNQIEKVSHLENEASQKAKDFIVGKNDNVADLVISGEKAKLALEFTVEMRNKIINAYKEIMRMPM